MSTELERQTSEPAASAPAPVRGRVWLVLLGAVALAAALLAWLTVGDELRSLIPRTPEAVLRALVVPAVGFAGLYLLLGRVTRRRGIRAAVMGIAVVAFTSYAVAPVFTDQRVEDALPVAAPASAGTVAGTPQQPQRLATGALRGIDHRATGGAALLRLPDGTHTVRLEGIDIQNGPDLYVYLVPKPGQTSESGGVNLGRLKGNQGSQNYPVPADVDVSGYATVLIYCRLFATPFANATLT